MTDKDRLLFLGTGASMGVPVVGCSCHVCKSTSPNNKRLRPSVLLHIAGKRFLIDCGPDFREQALRIGLESIDGILLTHAHNDHTAGLDDLRSFYLREKKKIPLLLSIKSLEDVQRRFHYLFDPLNKETSPGIGAHFAVQLLEGNEGETVFQGVSIRYFSYEQMGMQVNGFRIGNLAYVSDIRQYPQTIFESLQGVDTLVLSALRFTPSLMHFSVDEAIDFTSCVAPKRTFLMHISHELDHDSTNVYLPDGIKLAYDGLELEFLGAAKR